MKDALHPFALNTTQGKGNRFRLSFRNHRKIVVIVGDVAYFGGHNVGDEYLGKDPVLTPWRDTLVELRGPSCYSRPGAPCHSRRKLLGLNGLTCSATARQINTEHSSFTNIWQTVLVSAQVNDFN